MRKRKKKNRTKKDTIKDDSRQVKLILDINENLLQGNTEQHLKLQNEKKRTKETDEKGRFIGQVVKRELRTTLSNMKSKTIVSSKASTHKIDENTERRRTSHGFLRHWR